MKNINKPNNFTNRDLNSFLSTFDLNQDQRNYTQILCDALLQKHTFLNLLTYKSALTPLFIRFTRFIFEIFTTFVLNTYLFSENMIEINNKTRFTQSSNQLALLDVNQPINYYLTL